MRVPARMEMGMGKAGVHVVMILSVYRASKFSAFLNASPSATSSKSLKKKINSRIPNIPCEALKLKPFPPKKKKRNSVNLSY